MLFYTRSLLFLGFLSATGASALFSRRVQDGSVISEETPSSKCGSELTGFCLNCPPAGQPHACCHWTNKGTAPKEACEVSWPLAQKASCPAWCGSEEGPSSDPSSDPGTTRPLPPKLSSNFRPWRVNYVISLPTLIGGENPAPVAPANPDVRSVVILSFLEPHSGSSATWLTGAVGEWANLSGPEKAAVRSQYPDTKFMASLGGAAAKKWNEGAWWGFGAAALGKKAATFVLDLGLDGLDVDLEGLPNDGRAVLFLKTLTDAARSTFDAVPGGKKFLLSHAPQMPDFYDGTNSYALLAADAQALAQIDFFNVQFYNQNMYASDASLFNEDDLNPGRPGQQNSLAGIVQRVVELSKGAVKPEEVNEKLLLGFPCGDGSMPVGDKNLNLCADDSQRELQFDLVRTGVTRKGVRTEGGKSGIGYPLAGVFEWSKEYFPTDDLRRWNNGMAKALSCAKEE